MNSDTPVVVGAFVTIIAGFLAVGKIMLGSAQKEREADRAERLKLSDAIEHMAQAKDAEAKATAEGFDKLAKSSDKVEKATTKSAQEAKERNGHLAEQTIMVGKMAQQGLELQEKTLTRLEKSATLLVKDTKKTADATEAVRVIAEEDRGKLTNQDVEVQNVSSQVIKGEK